MNDLVRVRSMHGIGDLRYNRCDFVRRERSTPLGVSLKQLTRRPLDGQKVNALAGLAELDGSYDIGVLDPGTERGLAEETGNRRSILAQLVAQYLQRNSSMLVMGGPVDRSRAALSNSLLEGVAGYGGASEGISRHPGEPKPRAALEQANGCASKGVHRPMETRPVGLNVQKRPQTPIRRALLLVGTASLVASCGGGRNNAPGEGPSPSGAARSSAGPEEFDVVSLFRRVGLLARGAPMPFVGSVSFFAAESPDSTHTVIAVSLANAALTFAREDNRFRAGYSVTITLRTGPTVVRSIEAHEDVVIGSFKETTRSDESVLYEEILTLAPGQYEFTVSVRDDGSARSSEDAATLDVPAVLVRGLSTPVSFATATVRTRLAAIPQIVVNPTAAAIFGRDTVIPFFLESYGGSRDTERVDYAVRSETGQTIFSDSATLATRGALHVGTLDIPVARIGIGAMTIAAWKPGTTDTVRAPLFVGFGADLPLATYEEMVNYLRWFASPFRIQQLKDSPGDQRPAAWNEFVRYYQDHYQSPDALRDYFGRMADANARFREEASPGWMTDRGRVLLGLGRPDQVFEQVARTLADRGRMQIWEYRTLNMAVNFVDQTGFGRWRLTTASEAEFMTAWRRRVQ